MSDIYTAQFAQTKGSSDINTSDLQEKKMNFYKNEEKERQLEKHDSANTLTLEQSPDPIRKGNYLPEQLNDSASLQFPSLSPDTHISPIKEENETPGMDMDDHFVTHKVISPDMLSPLSSKLEASISPIQFTNPNTKQPSPKNGLKMQDLQNNQNNKSASPLRPNQTISLDNESLVEVMSFNNELKGALIVLKNDNDQLREGLQYVISGGDPGKVADYFDQRQRDSEFKQKQEQQSQQKDQTPQSNAYLFGDINESGFMQFDDQQSNKKEEPLRISQPLPDMQSSIKQRATQIQSHFQTYGNSTDELQLVKEQTFNDRDATIMSAPDFTRQASNNEMNFNEKENSVLEMTDSQIENTQQNVREFAKNIDENSDYLYQQDRNQLRENKQKMRDFKKKLPNLKQARQVIAKQKVIHERVLKMNAEAQTPDLEMASQNDISQSVQSEYQESPKKMPTKFNSPFIKNVIQNVNKAFKYRPGVDNQPIYNFNATYTREPMTAQPKKVKMLNQQPRRASVMDQTAVTQNFEEETGQNTRRGGMSVGPSGNFVSQQAYEEDNPFNCTDKGLMKKSWLDPVRPVEDPLANKKWVSKRKRGPIQDNPDYHFASIKEKHVDQFYVRVKDNLEEKSTHTFLNKQDDKKKLTYQTMNPVFKYYSNWDIEKQEAVQGTIAELRVAAENASRWTILGANGPGGKKNHMKNSMIEKYGAYAIDLGINTEMNTELNMSPEGKLRRKALVDKDKADAYFEEFTKKYKNIDQEKKLNFTLKRVENE